MPSTYNRELYLRNRDKYAANQNKWIQANQEKLKEYHKKYHALKNEGNLIRKLTPEERRYNLTLSNKIKTKRRCISRKEETLESIYFNLFKKEEELEQLNNELILLEKEMEERKKIRFDINEQKLM